MNTKLLTLFFIVIASVLAKQSLAQSSKIDSLLTNLKGAKEDTNKVNTLNILSREYINIGSFDMALQYGNTAFQIAQQLNFKKGIATSCGNIGVVYANQGDYPKALEYWLRALKIDEELNDKSGMATRIGNIGNIYRDQGDYSNALNYFFRALKMDEELKNKNGITRHLGNIGSVYYYQRDYPKALDYDFKALKMAEELKDKNAISRNLGNIGTIYTEQKDYTKSLEYFFRALKIREELGDKRGVTINLGNIGSVYREQKDYIEAQKYLIQALAIDTTIKYPLHTKDTYEQLSELYAKTNRHELALEYYKKAMALKDTLFNEEKNKELTRKEMNYEFDKKEAVTKAEFEADKKQQKIITGSVAGGLLIVLVFSGFIFRSLRVTNKQKRIIEKQKLLVEEHQKDIIDSITYAKRLQEAILPPLDFVKKHLPDTFILYKPKDIVAGDFYWMEVIGDTILIAAADCTGHGVPGAMVSVVCSNALNRSVKEFGLRDTGKILDKVTELVLETFEKSDKDVKDGMDISLLAINKNTKQIQWSGANNPLWYIQNGELIDITANKQPIGKHDNAKPFTVHNIVYEPNTTFYLFTDGYADQFGGIKGKKFKYKQLEERLVLFSNKPLEEQKDLLAKAFDEWKGNLEQVDDVCIIGIKC